MAKTLVVLLGPTGVGKTESALMIAEQLGVPIINADSRQIYRELPIGTAAPTAEQQARVKHFFVGTHSISDYYSAAQYESDVLTLLGEQFAQSDVAFMTGGSMMYIDAVCNGIDELPNVDERTRQWLKDRLEQEGLPELLKELQALDPKHYATVDRQNPRRILHALEICHITGKPYSSFRTGQAKQRSINIVKLGLNREREELYERINSRVWQMVEDGLEQEARGVYAQRELNALNTVGYKEFFRYFDGAIDREEAIRQIQSNSRRYMRKQLTWFQRDSRIEWFVPASDGQWRQPHSTFSLQDALSRLR